MPAREAAKDAPVLDSEAAAHFRFALETGITHLGVSLPPGAADAFLVFAERLLQTNRHTNLTRITVPDEVAVKHFVDSLSVLVACPDLPPGARVADIGTGAGFPGLPLALARPDLNVVLVDALAKRLRFLESVTQVLGRGDVVLVHARAEDVGRESTHRERFDLVVARAVAVLPTLLEWCAPLVRIGGRFLALKSALVDDELAASTSAASILGVRLVRDLPVTLPPVGGDPLPCARRLLLFEKTRATPPRYPRRTSEIKTKPL